MIAKKTFGRTGHWSTRAIFGGASLSLIGQDDADRTLEVLLAHGVNHLDVAAGYGHGEAEKRMGPWMSRYRDQFFLATKTEKRTYQEAREQIQLSLERLRVDRVDLIQLHNLTDPDEWETAMGPQGALDALIEAKNHGWTRFAGVTGHGMYAPVMHLKSIERFDFDSVLLPYNFVVMQDPDYARSFDELVHVCRQRNIAVQTIKSIARRPWGKDNRNRACWYEPFEDQADVNRAVHWVLGHPDLFLVAVGDIHVLPRVLQAAGTMASKPTDSEMLAMLERHEMQPIFEGGEALNQQWLKDHDRY